MQPFFLVSPNFLMSFIFFLVILNFPVSPIFFLVSLIFSLKHDSFKKKNMGSLKKKNLHTSLSSFITPYWLVNNHYYTIELLFAQFVFLLNFLHSYGELGSVPVLRMPTISPTFFTHFSYVHHSPNHVFHKDSLLCNMFLILITPFLTYSPFQLSPCASKKLLASTTS